MGLGSLLSHSAKSLPPAPGTMGWEQAHLRLLVSVEGNLLVPQELQQ